MTNEQLLAYYVGLLIMQFTGNLSIQTVTFSAIPASGNFQFLYGTVASSNIAWNANNATIIAQLESITGFSNISITSGSLSAGTLTVSFGNTQALVLVTQNITLEDSGSNPITTVTSGDLVKAAGTIQALTSLNIMNQLPIIVQNAWNLIPTAQTLTFSAAPSTGVFSIQLAVTSTPSISNTSTASINYNDTNQIIENKVNAILPSGSVAVSGGLASGVITLTFEGVNPSVVSVVSNTTTQTVTVTTNLAFGAQLDTIGKYVGVSRNSNSAAGPVTLDDSDFLKLIQLGIIVSNFGSSLAQIQNLLFTFFQGNIRVFDYQNMQMSYAILSGYFSNSLVECFISEGLLPKPMGVQLSSVIVVPTVDNLFSFCTYQLASTGSGFNTYDSYSLDSPWLTYNDAVGV